MRKLMTASLREGTGRGTARGNEREQGDGLFVDGNERAVNRDDNFVGKEDPLRLEERVVERAEPRQERRQHDDDDAETGDRPMRPGHVLQSIVARCSGSGQSGLLHARFDDQTRPKLPRRQLEAVVAE